MMGSRQLQNERQKTRLDAWDYSSAGWYYVTICTADRKCILASVANGHVTLSEAGVIAEESWLQIPGGFPGVELDDFVIMPDHVHGIIILNPDTAGSKCGVRGGLINQTPTKIRIPPEDTDFSWILMKQRGISLGKIIRAFKARSSRLIRLNADPGFAWQRNYYDHIVRNEDDLRRIRTYIRNNPLHWNIDKEKAGGI